MASNLERLESRPFNWASLSWLRLEPPDIRALPDPCLADPLRPETWRSLVMAQDEARLLATTMAPLARMGHA